MEKEKFMTLHPQGKKGVNIDKDKYILIRDYIIETIKAQGEITYQDLDDLAVKDMRDSFDGSVTWYVVSVKLDLEARKTIERIPKSSPHKLRMAT